MTSGYLDRPIRNRLRILSDSTQSGRIDWHQLCDDASTLEAIVAEVQFDEQRNLNFVRAGGNIETLVGWQVADLMYRDITCLLAPDSEVELLKGSIAALNASGIKESRLTLRHKNGGFLAAHLLIAMCDLNDDSLPDFLFFIVVDGKL